MVLAASLGILSAFRGQKVLGREEIGYQRIIYRKTHSQLHLAV